MILTNRAEERIKFSEVDSMGIMWHGHYIKLFEEGRELFGLKYGLDYLKVFNDGFYTPIIKTEINHHAPLIYGDTAIIEVNFIFKKAAKLVFDYKIFSKNNGKLVTTGQTIQVFLDKNMNLQITNPPFFEKWKEKYFPNE